LLRSVTIKKKSTSSRAGAAFSDAQSDLRHARSLAFFEVAARVVESNEQLGNGEK
jgi:hypothetical protein